MVTGQIDTCIIPATGVVCIIRNAELVYFKEFGVLVHFIEFEPLMYQSVPSLTPGDSHILVAPGVGFSLLRLARGSARGGA